MDKYFQYLDNLYKQQIVTPFNAADHLITNYAELTEAEARKIAVKWSASYSERNQILLEEGN